GTAATSPQSGASAEARQAPVAQLLGGRCGRDRTRAGVPARIAESRCAEAARRTGRDRARVRIRLLGSDEAQDRVAHQLAARTVRYRSPRRRCGTGARAPRETP